MYSERSLQRIFNRYGLKRYDGTVTPQQVANAIQVYIHIVSLFKINMHAFQ